MISLPRGVCATSGWNCRANNFRERSSKAPCPEFPVTATDWKPAGRFVSLSPCEFQTCKVSGRLAKITNLPAGFKSVAVTENSDHAAFEDRSRKLFALQFHPEVAHTPRGKEIIANFVHNVCGCGKKWTMRNYIDQAVGAIREQVGSENVILGLSGGVDSSVAAALLHKAIGGQLRGIFVNNGVLRGREAQVVREVFGRHFRIKLQYVDAAKLFLRRLDGITNPERKRKMIGKTFIEVFE